MHTITPQTLIDLHLHLDGAITPDIARELAKIQGQTLPDSGSELAKLLCVPKNCADLNEYLKRFDLPISLLQTKDSISEAVYLVQERLIEENIIYAELRFAPQSFMQRGLTQREVIEAALDGLSRSRLCCNLILCCMRGNGNSEANIETLKLTKEYLVKHGGVVAADLAGAEGLFPTSAYRKLFALAARLDIPFTIHAGEASGAESVRCALEMGARRIGHGVRAAEDPQVVDMIKNAGVTLEICPTSNLQTHAFLDMSQYPLSSFLKQDVAVALCTDNPAISNTTLSAEYAYVKDKLGITSVQFQKMLANAANAAFTDDKTREWLKASLYKLQS